LYQEKTSKMHAHDLAHQGSDESAEGDQPAEELKSGIVATAKLDQTDATEAETPAWSEARPSPLLPHDPVAFERPPPLPDHTEVLRAVAEEALGNGLCRRMF
jgi:hypothetical protein